MNTSESSHRVPHKNTRICNRSGKTCFSKRKQALTQASVRAKEQGIVIRVYKCEFCRDFHLTSK